MTFLRALLLIVAVFAAGPAATPAFAQDGTITTEEGSSTATRAEADAAIANRIRDILHELEGYEDVTVSVRAGIVTLRGTTLEASLADTLDVLVARVEGVVATRNEVTLSTSVTDRLAPVWERLVGRAQQAVAFLPLLVVALAVFIVVTWIGHFIARRRQPWDRLAPNAFIAEIYRSVIKLASVVAGIVAALDILGATALLSTILGAAGIVGLAIGFAVRDTVENFIASILLSVRQPFQPNDAVEIEGDEGKVIRLTSRATILLNWDGNHVRIPNATVYKARILNYSRNPERRFTFDIGVGPGTDLAAAKALAEETVAALPFVLDTPAASSWTTVLNGSEIGMKVAGWIDQRETDLNAARSEAIRLVLIAFDRAGIALPDPSYRLITEPAEMPAVPAGPAVSGMPEPAVPEDAAGTIQDVAATAELELDRMINEERAETGVDDLLGLRHRPE